MRPSALKHLIFRRCRRALLCLLVQHTTSAGSTHTLSHFSCRPGMLPCTTPSQQPFPQPTSLCCRSMARKGSGASDRPVRGLDKDRCLAGNDCICSRCSATTPLFCSAASDHASLPTLSRHASSRLGTIAQSRSCKQTSPLREPILCSGFHFSLAIHFARRAPLSKTLVLPARLGSPANRRRPL